MSIIKAVNRARRQAGYGQLPTNIVPRMRPARSVFLVADEEQQAA